MYVTSRAEKCVDVEVAVADTGVGMDDKKVDGLFRDLEQVRSEPMDPFSLEAVDDTKQSTSGEGGDGKEKRALGLGLAVVARIIRNMNGQMRLKSEEGKGTRFVLQFPFELPDGEQDGAEAEIPAESPSRSSATVTEGEEVTLVKRDNTVTARGTRRGSAISGVLEKRNSTESLNSMNSMKSVGSGQSGRSDVDRLIEAIQEPHMGEGKRWGSQQRPNLETRHSYAGVPMSPQRSKARIIEHGVTVTPEHQREMRAGTPGEERLPFSGQPLRAIKIPDDEGLPVGTRPLRPSSTGAVIGEIDDEQPAIASKVVQPGHTSTQRKRPNKELDAKEMHVLVAEDDPINSKIVKKRMESRGHKVHLTTNGEECASAYCEQSGAYDLVLMDMQVSFRLAT
jgi:CheY-like chemotaxis protein